MSTHTHSSYIFVINNSSSSSGNCSLVKIILEFKHLVVRCSRGGRLATLEYVGTYVLVVTTHSFMAVNSTQMRFKDFYDHAFNHDNHFNEADSPSKTDKFEQV